MASAVRNDGHIHHAHSCINDLRYIVLSLLYSAHVFAVVEYRMSCVSRGMSGVTHMNGAATSAASFIWSADQEFQTADLELWWGNMAC